MQHIKYCDGISKRAKPASAIPAKQKITIFFAKRVVEDEDTESEPEPPEPFVWDAGDASLDNSLDDSFDLLFQDPFAADMLRPAEPRGPGARSRDAILERLGASSRPVAASKPKPQPMNVDVEIIDLADSDGEDELCNEAVNPNVLNQEGEDQLPNEHANPAVVNQDGEDEPLAEPANPPILNRDPIQTPEFPIGTPNPLMKLPALTTVWSTDTEEYDTAILRNAPLKYMHAWKANPKLAYVPSDTTEVPSTTVAARAHNTPIFGKGKDDTTRYAKKPRKTPLAAEHADYEKNMEYLQEKHAEKRGKQKAVPHNFQVGTLVCYAKEDDTPGYAYSVAGKAARTSIYVRHLRPRPANFQEEGRVALEWASEATMLPYNKVHEAGVSHRIVHGYIIMEKDVYDTVLAAARRMHL